MAITLTQTAKNFKSYTRLGGIVLAIFIGIRIIFVIYDLVLVAPTRPPEEAVANPLYGTLPLLEIERVPINLPTNFAIYLDLASDKLPDKPTVAQVYPILKSPYGFLSADRAKNLAETFNLNTDPTKLSATESLWVGLNETLRVNDQTLNFKYEYNYGANPAIMDQADFNSQQQIKDLSTNLISQHINTADTAPDLATANPNVFLLVFQNNRLQPTDRIYDAMAARVDLYRKDITFTLSNAESFSVPFVSPNYIGSNINMLLTSWGTSNPTLMQLEYTYWHYNKKAGADYPLISSDIAWGILQSDPTLFTVYLGNQDLGPLDRNTSVPVVQEIKIKKIYLAYYDPQDEQDFIQPVWVFSGKGTIVEGGTLDWVGYVPAVHPDYISSTE